MKAEIISVGTELLLGEIDDTNASFISRRLAALGVDVHFRHTVGDNLERLVQMLHNARRRADIIIMCGGLGPTQDDLTREALAELTQRPLHSVPEAEFRLRQFFAERGRTPTPSNFKQVMVPRGGELLDNPVGTAPGLWLQHEQNVFVAVPGPPPEMSEMIDHQVLPRLRLRLQLEGGVPLWTRTLRLAGVGESGVADDLHDLLAAQTDPSLALYASPGEVRVRMATKAAEESAAHLAFGPVEQEIRRRLGAAVYGVDDETMEVAVGQALVAAGATLATAESCTGGRLASRLTDVPGSTRYFQVGYVTYSNQAKQDLLGVPAELLEKFGAVSPEVAAAMAEGARQRSGADYAVAVTGIAGPDGGTPDKPVGLVYLAVSDAAGTETLQQSWPGSREQFKQRVSQLALDLVRRRVIGTDR
ncbi:MAG TPA: competence/damage-inducible protein A [Armatimonadota bacterium]